MIQINLKQIHTLMLLVDDFDAVSYLIIYDGRVYIPFLYSLNKCFSMCLVI
jgi:hypothetical protein